MLVTLTQFRGLATDRNGNVLPMGKDRIGCKSLTAAGAFAALDLDCAFVRLATDTSIQCDITGSNTTAQDELFVAGSVEYLAVNGGETLTIALA
jgi:hypothetical protein